MCCPKHVTDNTAIKLRMPSTAALLMILLFRGMRSGMCMKLTTCAVATVNNYRPTSSVTVSALYVICTVDDERN